MDDTTFEAGKILADHQKGTKYRIIYVGGDDVVLCEMGITKLNLLSLPYDLLCELVCDQSLELKTDTSFIFDRSSLSSEMQEKYDDRKQIMAEVSQIYGPDYLKLMGRKQKPELYKILNEHSMTRFMFWRLMTRYLQSGMRSSALVDERCFGVNKGKTYHPVKKAGRKTEYTDGTDKPLTEDDYRHFDQAIKYFRSGKAKSIAAAFRYMNSMFYTHEAVINGHTAKPLLPANERPTEWQFRYYFSKHVSKEDVDRIKSSAQEQRNNKRLLDSDVRMGLMGPGDLVECDASEMNVSLVSEIDENRTIGRPTMYLMVDDYTGAIIAVSVGLEVNSVQGLTNLLLNLVDDKQEVCSKYGVELSDPRDWPSNILPNRIRVDRGSEFKSDECMRICQEVGIELDNVTGGTGSYKGVVEDVFNQVELMIEDQLEGYGLIRRDYDSNHHKQAALTLTEYTKVVINVILEYNEKYNKDYPLTKDMLKEKVEPIPVLLWQYGLHRCAPRQISDPDEYKWALLTPITPKVSKKGIYYKGLCYLPEPGDDPELKRDRYNAGDKRVDFPARIDKRTMGAIYYNRDGQLVRAPLNERRTGNTDFALMTMEEWDDIRKYIKKMDAKGKIHNEEIASDAWGAIHDIMKNAKKTNSSDTKDMRSARRKDKNLAASENTIDSRLSGDQKPSLEDQLKSDDAKPSEKEIDDDLMSADEWARFEQRTHKHVTKDNK